MLKVACAIGVILFVCFVAEAALSGGAFLAALVIGAVVGTVGSMD